MMKKKWEIAVDTVRILVEGTALRKYLQVSKALLLLEANMQRLCQYLQVVNFQSKYAKTVQIFAGGAAQNPCKSQLCLRNIQMHPHV